MEQILVIDDDVKLCELLEEYLETEGFQMVFANDGRLGAQKAASFKYDLIILDVMLPEMNGFEVLRSLRDATVKTPVIMLTARDSEVDRIVGLEMGADDYLPKPFNPRELIARIRAVLRRTKSDRDDVAKIVSSSRIIVGDVEMDAATRVVLCAGEMVELTSVEFSLLENLLRNAGKLVPREELFKNALGREISPYDRSVDVHVSKLRKKLRRNENGIERIKTIRSVGYLYTLVTEAEKAAI